MVYTVHVMAKLSAHGRTELLRVSKSDNYGTHYKAYMSDGAVLTKMKYPTFSDTWKLRGHLKDGVTIDQIRSKAIESGWTVEY